MSPLTPTTSDSSSVSSTSSGQTLPSQADELRQAIHNSLGNSPFRELDALPMHVSSAAIRIGGQVSSFYLKQMVQEIVRKIAPQHRIENDVTVAELKRISPR